MKETSPIWNGTADISWYNEQEKEFTISTAEQLAGLAELVNSKADLEKFFRKTVKLGADIVLNDTANWQDWENNPPANEWVSIGNCRWSLNFNGIFDGNGFLIKGVYTNGNGGGGLFGFIIMPGEIKNLGVVDSYIKGSKEQPRTTTGGLLTYNLGTVRNCYFIGTVIGGQTGGLVGENTRIGDGIINSYSAGTVIGQEEELCGGLVAHNYGNVSNCYSSCKVIGKGLVGGLMVDIKQGSVESITTEQMKQKETFVDWDFENVWGIDSKINNGYPYLKGGKQ